MKAIGPLALITLFLAGCASQQRPAPAPVPQATPAPVRAAPVPTVPRTVAPPPTADWRDAPQTPGAWSWQKRDGRSVASFGSPASALLTLGCNPAARQVAIGYTPGGPLPSLLTITTTFSRRALDMASENARAVAILSASDGLLDDMAFSRGRFMVEAPGNRPLYVPSAPEISRVVEDCR
ncbi:hypothetical protein [Novosphingobium sp. TH158]|uniref:hypothetical protein n=1 Tax=Novosphingobium sp. TH158 TaxID=2067455 RepID=UPI0013045630|nr:hypothetical protein [Novosphingobium sp. TH158]